MSFVGDVIGDVVGSITGSKQAGQAAQDAAVIQAQSSERAIEEQRRQFDALQKLLAPYVAAGVGGEGAAGALQAQQALLGLRGAEEQTSAIRGIEQGPLYSEMARQGEEALLQQASATGGLRGGNVQAALAQFRPQLLNELITQQYQRLGGLTNIGQSSAAGVGASGMEQASNISNLLAQQGAALAGGRVAQGQTAQRTFGNVLGIAGAASGFF